MFEETATYETTDAATDRVESLSLLDRSTATLAYSFASEMVAAAKQLHKDQEHAMALAKSFNQAFPTVDPEWVADQILLETETTAARSRIEMANLLADQLLAAIKAARETCEDWNGPKALLTNGLTNAQECQIHSPDGRRL